MPDKPLVWLGESVRSPPFSAEARKRAGLLLRRLQRGETLSMPESRPMPSIGPRCHELRIADHDQGKAWRIIYRLDFDAIVIVDAFSKKTRGTPTTAIRRASRRLHRYDKGPDGGSQ
ncbi:MAG: type II toxin-antitoxin system RelE/ParE family toxin [Deltaproteobacteria bacterium]|nr:type II toxin-antitoxin system RelE/ParE family toxin [Deltaproteobacteria bacterium]NNE47198.1 type II toxin-antitoxin system RelE/ParE family toxin [Rhodothermales bacterium]NNK41516.1 type II toxin-antitoxin system RelE/ParE family toxin [Myxococcales bacterium]RZV49223.1 MAG: type II toxin-antitoxin system RelE/ParE family toxin [Deltaproteobacteria bacterium]